MATKFATVAPVVNVCAEAVGATAVFTTIVVVVVDEHCPTFGVNVYVVVATLFIAGDHVPVIPFKDVVAKGDVVVPAQIGAIAANDAVVFAATVTAKVAVFAHCPAPGVKVYVAEVVLLKVGDQVPVTPFVEVVGSDTPVAPLHITNASNLGSIKMAVGALLSVVVPSPSCPKELSPHAQSDPSLLIATTLFPFAEYFVHEVKGSKPVGVKLSEVIPCPNCP